MRVKAAALALLLVAPATAFAQALPKAAPAPATRAAPAKPGPMAPAASVTDGDCVAMTNVAMQSSQKQGGQVSPDALAGAMFFTGRLSARDPATAKTQLDAAKVKLRSMKQEQGQAVLNRCAQTFQDSMKRMSAYVGTN